MESRIFTTKLAGKDLSFEFGKYGQQANSSVWVKMGDTVVMVNVTMSSSPREGIDFFPLNVDYEEKQYSVGKIPGGFLKREGRPTEKAILTCRLIDRPLRPMFNKGMRNDVQVLVTVLSVDPDVSPEIPAMLGSSIALCVSDIPFAGPTAAVVIGYVDGKYVVCPDSETSNKSKMHLTVAGTADAVLMVEAGAQELSEEVMLDGILFAHEEIKKLVQFQNDIVKEIGKEKTEVFIQSTGEDVEAAVREYAYDKCVYTFETYDRIERQNREEAVKNDTLTHFAETFEGREVEILDALYNLNKEVMRNKILTKGIRPDGRGLTDIRPIWCEVGVLPRTHGSAVFTRGQTQALTVTTLGPMSDGQVLDGLSEEDFKRYIHHYNFPPYATGEAGRSKSPGRREIGHGALAERALIPVIPTEDEFPYALRLVSEIMSSNGSSSMASVCGSTLSLMDAGVPIHAPVAGCAMGLIQDKETGKVVVLTDIQGLEDFLGDMDFKVAGTMNGITAIQMDIKIKGINKEILSQALKQALDGRLYILKLMLDCIGEPRKELSKFAPKIIRFTINPEKIREVIGPGGKMINKIIEETGVKIDIEDDGRVYIATPDADAAQRAKDIILGIAKDIEVGDEYLGKVVRIMSFGAFLELLPGKDGMLHISKMAANRVEKVEDVMNEGDFVPVKVTEIDAQGRVNLIRTDIDYSVKKTDSKNEHKERRRPPRRNATDNRDE